MKTFYCVIAAGLLYFAVDALPAFAQIQELEGYTFIQGQTGTQVCVGTWIPPTSVGAGGVCEGQLMDVAQLTALSSKQSADRLDQLLTAIYSLDQKMADNNNQMRQLVDATLNTQAAIDEQIRQVGEILTGTIARRFDSLPGELLENDLFREEIKKLREDILLEVKRYYSRRPMSAPPK